MITYFLIFIVVSLACGFAVQGYEGLALKLEVLGYSVEANVVFVVFMLCVLFLFIVLVGRACFACALCMYRVRRGSVSKKYDEVGKSFAFLSVGHVDNVRKIVGISERFAKFDSPVLQLLEGCASFRIGQYEIAEKHFSLIPSKALQEVDLGAWLVGILANEKSRDCKLRVLSRLCDVFHSRRWSVLFRLEIARMEGQWDEVLTALKLIEKYGISHPYDLNDLELIARCKLAELHYMQGDFKEGLGVIKGSSGLQATLWRAKFNAKLNNVKRAMEELEACYRVDPHPDVASLYLSMVQDKSLAVEKLNALNPDSYMSFLLMVRKYMDLKQYNAAEKHLKQALTQYKYAGLYGMMLEIMVRLGNLDEIEYWIDMMRKDSVPDMHWACEKCCYAPKEWCQECDECEGFNTIKWRG
ncbi:hypothetical protein ANAPC1_01017 [Anaplasma phagocytophilum]|uniref:Tetratricopeptide repeat family protein n=1 Tax=Anaplasma phagocytophilum TaxID=948 RepID=A0AA45UTG9_ANAPH|nr:hypothetical protein [Anaplasma phagocytophilum]SBO14656.1 hypothetical protein ANAPC1_01017 [Anaplasma phagocytophilum]